MSRYPFSSARTAAKWFSEWGNQNSSFDGAFLDISLLSSRSSSGRRLRIPNSGWVKNQVIETCWRFAELRLRRQNPSNETDNMPPIHLAVGLTLAERTTGQRRVAKQRFRRNLPSTTDTQAILATRHPFQGFSKPLHGRSRLVRQDVCLQDNREDLVGRGIRLRNDTPHPELVQDLNESLVVVLTQCGIELSNHRQLDPAQICNACHSTIPPFRQPRRPK